MEKQGQSAWEKFRSSPSPLAKVRELKAALPEGPGLSALYLEARNNETVLGVPVLTVGRNIFVSRLRVVDVIEGRDGRNGGQG